MKRRMSFVSLSLAALVLCAHGADLFVQKDRRPENESLLETIKIEAANMEVFPVDLIADSPEGAINIKTIGNHAEGFGRGDHQRKWSSRYELTFERYIPFFRFKTRVGLASAEEIDEIVARFNHLTVKEKALAITAIFIFERVRRRPLKSEKRLSPNGSPKQRFSFYPFYPIHSNYYDSTTLLFPEYKPDNSISNKKWNEWLSVIENCLEVKAEAFPTFETEDEKELSSVNYDSFPQDSKSSLLWNEQWKRCRDLAARLFDDSDIYYGLDSSDFQWGREFLERVYELELDPSQSRFDLRFALRDYYFAAAVLNADSSGGVPRQGNSSLFPKTLGDIADQLLKSRLEYDSSEPNQAP